MDISSQVVLVKYQQRLAHATEAQIFAEAQIEMLASQKADLESELAAARNRILELEKEDHEQEQVRPSQAKARRRDSFGQSADGAGAGAPSDS